MKGPRVDRLFRAFADRTRLRILRLLRGGEVCVCDIMAVLRVPQPKVSRHLGYLKRAGLVADRRDGAWRHYSLVSAKSAAHRRLLACVDACLDGVPAIRRDAEKLRAARRRSCA
ncbi:MAG: metalloregulator ArsR/SmtB family transcription factor [Elusimicrobia bacterium]|nr:metalloregulator ArsR/SmtB family transcription factor [Elusimicrobiota bacterium]